MKLHLSRFIVVPCLLTQLVTQAQTAAPTATFTNPTPHHFGSFGGALAAVGTDKYLIADEESPPGVAYLFRSDGTLLTAFTNPMSAGGHFARAVAPAGQDKVLIGAPGNDSVYGFDSGLAYLFGTDGALLTTFTNPTPAGSDWFGSAVAMAGTDSVIIGALGVDVGLEDVGKAYLFALDGALLTTFTNPRPRLYAHFGSAMAALGNDRVLIAARQDGSAGQVYLFNTNGSLLTTFTNPAPASQDKSLSDQFGAAVAAVGLEEVLIGAPGDDLGMTNAGVAYLFTTNGTLLTTFTNPTPDYEDLFGSAVAALGPDKVLIGAYKDPGRPAGPGGGFMGGPGTLYLYSTNGMLLAVIANPSHTNGDFFGCAVSGAGPDSLVVGARRAGLGGVAYLLNVAPSLTISVSPTNTLLISWASAWIGWTLEECTGPGTTNWLPSGPVTDTGILTFLNTGAPGRTHFYRLLKPR